MFDQATSSRSISDVLAGSAHFANVEPIADIAKVDLARDMYLALARTIEREVIPRLLLNTRQALARRNAEALLATAPIPPDVAEFCRIVLLTDIRVAETYVAKKIAAGLSLEGLLIDLFAPVARRLGELWESDECTFVDVTIALGKLQQLLRVSSEAYRIEPDPKKLGFRALLATVPSNQHTFGIFVVEEFFRQSGWNVLSLPAPTKEELLDAVQEEWFAVVGLSIGCDSSVPTVASLIADIRQASLNRSVILLIGGRYISENPEQGALLGADLSGSDAQAAIVRSHDFLKSIGR